VITLKLARFNRRLFSKSGLKLPLFAGPLRSLLKKEFSPKVNTPAQRCLSYSMTEELMDAIPAEVWSALADIKNAIPPVPPELRAAFGLVAAGSLLILVLSILNMWGK
jgi:hypothetical protein